MIVMQQKWVNERREESPRIPTNEWSSAIVGDKEKQRPLLR